MIRLSSGVLVYTTQEQTELARATTRPIWVASNAVTARNGTRLVSGRAMDVLQIGRLVESKRPFLTLEAWIAVADRLPASSRLIFVGSGPLRGELQARVRRSGFDTRILVLGHIGESNALERIFADALFSVSAGYAGLSITQSLAYGVPVAVADDEPHAPEIVLATGSNSRFFTAKDPVSLGRAMLQFFDERDAWLGRRRTISKITLDAYSVESMADGFLAASVG